MAMKYTFKKENPTETQNGTKTSKIDEEVIVVDNTSQSKNVQWEMNELDALKVNYVTKYNISISH
jgi:mevalonate kinase